MKKAESFLLLIIIVFTLILDNSFKKDDIIEVPDTITDIDGNVYNTISIGPRIWMVENLKTTRYNNGDLIGTTTTLNKDITGENNPKYQWPDAGLEENVQTWVRLYTWYAVKDSRGICPAGWHIPSDEDWETLPEATGAH